MFWIGWVIDFYIVEFVELFDKLVGDVWFVFMDWSYFGLFDLVNVGGEVYDF